MATNTDQRQFRVCYSVVPDLREPDTMHRLDMSGLACAHFGGSYDHAPYTGFAEVSAYVHRFLMRYNRSGYLNSCLSDIF